MVAALKPDGHYQADLERVGVIPDPRRRRYFLVMEATTDDATTLVARQPLASTDAEDAYALSKGQMRAWVKFAADLGIDARGRTVREVVARVERMVGGRVTVRVRSNRRAGRVACRMLPAEPTREHDGNLEELAQQAHALLLAGRRREDEGIVAQCEACYRLRADDLWTRLGYTLLGDYLAQPELGFKKSTFYNRANVWATFVEAGDVDPRRLVDAGPAKLRVVRRAVDEGLVEADEALDDAEAMGWRDLRQHYGEKYAALDGHDPPVSSVSTVWNQTGPAVSRLVEAAAVLVRAFRRHESGPALERLVEALEDALGSEDLSEAWDEAA